MLLLSFDTLSFLLQNILVPEPFKNFQEQGEGSFQKRNMVCPALGRGRGKPCAMCSSRGLLGVLVCGGKISQARSSLLNKSFQSGIVLKGFVVDTER